MSFWIIVPAIHLGFLCKCFRDIIEHSRRWKHFLTPTKPKTKRWYFSWNNLYTQIQRTTLTSLDIGACIVTCILESLSVFVLSDDTIYHSLKWRNRTVWVKWNNKLSLCRTKNPFHSNYLYQYPEFLFNYSNYKTSWYLYLCCFRRFKLRSYIDMVLGYFS